LHQRLIVSLTKTKPPAQSKRLAVGDEGRGLGLGFVIVLVAQSFAVIINSVIIGSKKNFAQRNPFGFTPTTLQVSQPPFFGKPTQVHLELVHANHPP
jgi:hypothetical protein